MTSSEMPAAILSGASGYFGGLCADFLRSAGRKVITAGRGAENDLRLDLLDPEAFADSGLEESADVFIHTAAANEVLCRQAPYSSIMANVAGTRAALEFCMNNDVKTFIYISTFHVFGHPQGRIDESTLPHSANDYGLTHLFAERYTEMYARERGIRTHVIRPSNLFGVPVDIRLCNRWTLIPLGFCLDAVREGRIVLKTPGRQKRNFVSARDVCRVIMELIALDDDAPALVHVPGPETKSVLEFAEEVVAVARSKFGHEVELFVPEEAGVQVEASDFSFCSQQLDRIYQPEERMKPFVEELLRLLMAESTGKEAAND